MVPDRIERMVIKFRDVLAETERLPPIKLHAYQESLLAPLIEHARRNVPFYERRLAPLFRGTEVDLSRWDEVPILTRADAQRATVAMTARIVPPHAGAVTGGETSGSTGRPLHYKVNELTDVASLAATDRTLRWWDFDGAKTMATFVAARPGLAPAERVVTVQGWRVGFVGPHHMMRGVVDLDWRIDWLREHQPNYLTAHSFTLLSLAERVRQRGVDLRFERINSTSSVLSDEIRDICREVLGTRPIDQYGARETGLIAGECPWCDHYHVNAETMLVEILDDDGRPTRPGARGRVVLTSLYNYAMPFIRYEVGDFAIAAPARVRCPIKLPALAQVLGRYRNSFTLHDRRVISPYVPVARLKEFISFSQFQIVQTDYREIEVRYVPLDPVQPADAAGLEACVRQLMDESFNVRVVAVDEIERSSSGKYEDYLSLVARPG